LKLGIKENIDRLKITETKLNKLINEGCGLGSNQYNDLNNNFTNQLQNITNEFNNQISTLENKIPSLPISSDNDNYTDFYNNTTKLDFYLKNVDVFRPQALWILNNLREDIKKLKEVAPSDPIILPITAAHVNFTQLDESIVPLSSYLNDVVTLPINASNVNYTKSDLTTVSLTTYINGVVNDIHVTIEKINQTFPLSAANVNYTNADKVTTTVQARLREIDEFDPSEVLKNISDMTKNVNDTIEDVKDIAESIEHVTKIAGTAIGVAELAEAATAAVAALRWKATWGRKSPPRP
jgi:hypothetical protein